MENIIVVGATLLGKRGNKPYPFPMPVRKKKTTASKSPAQKAPARKAAVKKATTKKTVKASRPAGPREQKLANTALKLVDEAAALLRQGIRTGANSSEKARHEAKQKAHSLLTKASSSLTDALQSGTSALHKVLGKI